MATTGNPPAIFDPTPNPPHPYFADLYTFNWKQLSFELPAIGAISIALCLVVGVLVGHPSAGLIAGGGAMTVAFGVNQRIADSRIAPMIFAAFAMFLSTLVGMTVGHNGYSLLLASAIWSFIYGLLTARAAGVAWVGQQAAVTLFVTSAFPAGPEPPSPAPSSFSPAPRSRPSSPPLSSASSPSLNLASWNSITSPSAAHSTTPRTCSSTLNLNPAAVY